MSAADVHRRWIEAVNNHDATAAATLYAPNAVVRDPAYQNPLEGREAIQKDFEDFFRAFPDLQFTVRTTIEADGSLASDGAFSGTHQGSLVTDAGEIPPTGKRIESPGAGFWRLDGQGRILEDRRYYDLAGLLSQIGVLN